MPKLCLSFFALFAVLAPCATLPRDTLVEVRLTTEATSQAPAGSVVGAVVIVPVFLDGVPVLAAGTALTGNTADVSPYRTADSAGGREQPATLRIQFTRVVDAQGRATPLYSLVAGVDNARESIDSSGLIGGILPSQTPEAQIDRGLDKLASQYGQFAQILSDVKGALLKPVDPAIDFKPGVELTLRLTRPLTWPVAAVQNLPGTIQPIDGLQAMVNSEPQQTTAQAPPKPSDLTNVMLIGSDRQIEDAFRAAGWSPARALSGASRMETARALIENRGYGEAPMSLLLLQGRPPDFTFEKGNDTFAMRHHIRIWRTPDTFNGQPVWIAAATHDIGITFSAASRSFTHKIDSNIDLERAKVVNDLLFTGAVRALSSVSRKGLPREASNATGDQLITDGQMAVLEF